jgi:hypothetical protein
MSASGRGRGRGQGPPPLDQQTQSHRTRLEVARQTAHPECERRQKRLETQFASERARARGLQQELDHERNVVNDLRTEVRDLSDEKIVLQQNLLNARTSLQETTARLEREMNVCAEALEATKQTLRESTEKLDEEKLLRAEEVKAADRRSAC